MASAIRKGVQNAIAVDKALNPSSQGEGVDLGIVAEALKDKASVEMINDMQASKANKVDIEMCLRWVDLLHRMCRSLANLHTLNFKQALDTNSHESANTLQNKKV